MTSRLWGMGFRYEGAADITKLMSWANCLGAGVRKSNSPFH